MRPARLRTWRMYRNLNPNGSLILHLTRCYLMYVSQMMPQQVMPYSTWMMVQLFYRWLHCSRKACMTLCNTVILRLKILDRTRNQNDRLISRRYFRVQRTRHKKNCVWRFLVKVCG